MTQQEIRGKAKKIRGKAKEAAGILAGDKKMEQQGALQRAEGTVEEGLGKARRKVGEFVSDLANAIKK